MVLFAIAFFLLLCTCVVVRFFDPKAGLWSMGISALLMTIGFGVGGLIIYGVTIGLSMLIGTIYEKKKGYNYYEH